MVLGTIVIIATAGLAKVAADCVLEALARATAMGECLVPHDGPYKHTLTPNPAFQPLPTTFIPNQLSVGAGGADTSNHPYGTISGTIPEEDPFEDQGNGHAVGLELTTASNELPSLSAVTAKLYLRR